MRIKNALTVDVEDYFQVSAFAKNVKYKDWGNFKLRVSDNTHRLLNLFDSHNVKATFFVLGWVAEREKALIEEIASRGHEVACHGYSHQLIYNQTPEIFREETIRSKVLLEDIVQKPVRGYRAASYSITKQSLWALDILAEVGFEYDSSIFPVKHDRYGIPDAEEVPHKLITPNGSSIVEFPLSTAHLYKYRLPIAGGGYFRLYPYKITQLGLKQVNRRGSPFIFYLHPWEIDSKQPKIETSWFSRFRHYNNLEKCEARLERLMKDFQFGTSWSVLCEQKLVDID